MMLLVALLIGIPAQAGLIQLDQLKINYDKNANQPVVFKPVIGRCDGKNFTDDAAYQGCQKNYAELHSVLPRIPDPHRDDGYRRLRINSTSMY